MTRVPILSVLSLTAALLLPPASPLSARQAAATEPSTAGTPLATFDAAWSAIRETYVDEARTDEEWTRLHATFRRRAAEARDEAAVRQVLRDLLNAIGRSHFELLPMGSERALSFTPADDSGDLGLEVAPVDGEVVIAQVPSSGPADAAGIRRGWVIEALDGLPLTPAVRAAGLKGHAAQSFRLWSAATARLRGAVGSRARMRVRDGDETVRQLEVVRVPQQGHPVKFGHLPTLYARLDHRPMTAPGGRRAYYVRFNIWMTAISRAIDEAMAGARSSDGVILDLRRNPGGMLAMLMGVSGHFLNEPLSLGTLRTRESELQLVANPRRVALDGSPTTPYAGRLAILVDESSYSASEIFAAGMQALGRARVFGSRTPGGALPAMLKELPNGDVLEYAIGDFVTSSGRHIEGHGVVPDEVVPLTRSALLAGKDPPLEAALAWIGGGATESARRVSAGEAR